MDNLGYISAESPLSNKYHVELPMHINRQIMSEFLKSNVEQLSLTSILNDLINNQDQTAR
jgi:hypothetical protein